MAKKRVFNHLHKYKRINIGTNGKEFLVFKCIQPTCTHYIRMDMAEGKLCECNRCGEPLVLDKFAMTLARPHCHNCVKRKKSTDVEKISSFLAGVIPD
jgi:formylmethanofuran dehydrogenase subunit E